jgi:hypothetical protein
MTEIGTVALAVIVGICTVPVVLMTVGVVVAEAVIVGVFTVPVAVMTVDV